MSRSVSHVFAVFHKVSLYGRDTLAAIIRKKSNSYGVDFRSFFLEIHDVLHAAGNRDIRIAKKVLSFAYFLLVVVPFFPVEFDFIAADCLDRTLFPDGFGFFHIFIWNHAAPQTRLILVQYSYFLVFTPRLFITRTVPVR